MQPDKCISTHTERNTKTKPSHLPGFIYTVCCSESIDDTGELPLPAETPQTNTSESTCAFCKNDYGIVLNKLSVYPICDTCKINLDKSIFPTWVKVFFCGILLLIVFSIFWNWRFYSAYRNLKKSTVAFSQGNLAEAAKTMTQAADDVPETEDLKTMAAYYRGIKLLSEDKSEAALAEFDKCGSLTTDFHVNQYTLQAEMGAGFDKKDYKLFLQASKGFLELDTTQASSWASVSSAYSCLYAQSSADSLKQLSLKYVNRAKTIDDTSKAAKQYYDLIQYRLDSKQIITRAQFSNKFPNGYLSTK